MTCCARAMAHCRPMHPVPTTILCRVWIFDLVVFIAIKIPSTTCSILMPRDPLMRITGAVALPVSLQSATTSPGSDVAALFRRASRRAIAALFALIRSAIFASVMSDRHQRARPFRQLDGGASATSPRQVPRISPRHYHERSIANARKQRLNRCHNDTGLAVVGVMTMRVPSANC